MVILPDTRGYSSNYPMMLGGSGEKVYNQYQSTRGNHSKDLTMILKYQEY